MPSAWRGPCTFLMAAGALALVGCGEPSSDESGDATAGCQGGKCDDADGALADALADRADPIGVYLRQELEAGRLTADGFLEGDYETVLRGIAGVQGCDFNTTRTFVVSDTLLSPEPFPRIISTICTGNKSAEFFISAPEQHGGELDLQFIEMFAFDKDRDEYVFYETFPTDDEATMFVNPSPTRCQQCHLTPSDYSPDGMRMTPIMNELTQPWTHWNGEPGFASHNFSVPEEVLDTDGWIRVVEPFLAPAADFEKLVRRGHFLAAKERRKAALRDEVTWENAMYLMRPLFCSEQVQYVTAKGGQVLDAAVVDTALGQRLSEMGLAPRWYKAPPNNLLQVDGSTTLDQIPVRGNADQLVENQLIGRGLTSEDVLRVRALDWHHPAFSQFRCEVWGDKFRSYVSGETVDLSSATELEEALPLVLDDILSVFPPPSEGGQFLAMGDDEAASVQAAFTGEGLGCADDGAGACYVTAEEFSDHVGNYLASFEGANGAQRLRGIRDERICHVTQQVAVEQLPTPVRSERFSLDADIQRCAERCCDEQGLEPDEEDLQWLQCESAVRDAIDDTVAGDTALGECALECGLPSRYPARPALPEVSGCEPPNFWPFGVRPELPPQ